MIKKRVLVGLATAGIIGGGVYGFAATLGVTSDNLSSGSAAVASCDTNGVNADYTVAYDATVDNATGPDGGYKVTNVTVTGLAAGCDEHAISVTIAGAANASLATLTGTIDESPVDGSESFPVGGTINAANVTAVHVAIDGVDTTP